MKPIYALEISLPATTKSTAVSYMPLSESQVDFLKGLMAGNSIIGFELNEKFEFGVILGKKAK